MSNPSDVYFSAAIVTFFFVISLLFCGMTVLAWYSADRRQQTATTFLLLGAASVTLAFLILFLLPRDSHGTTHEPFWVDVMLYGGFGLMAAGQCVKIWGTWFLPAFWVGSILTFSRLSHVKVLETLSAMLTGASVVGWKTDAILFGRGSGIK